MGKILQQKQHSDGVLAKILLTKDEAKELGGEMDDIAMFTPARASTPARVSLRGKREATKYFLIPRRLRKNLNTLGSVSCQRISRYDKDIFIYIVHSDADRKSLLPEEC